MRSITNVSRSTSVIARGARLVNSLRPRSGYDVVAVIAMTVALGTGGAYAADMITGADVQDESLQGWDIKDGSIKAADLGTQLSTHSSPLQVVQPNSWITVIALCPAGKKAIGGGFSSTAADIVASQPKADNTGWSVYAFNNTSDILGVAARVQCARIS